LYDEQEACYKLTPAYDLTYSHSLNGEHATTVNGNGINPDMEEILEVAVQAGIRETQEKLRAIYGSALRICLRDISKSIWFTKFKGGNKHAALF
ncbi:MAG: hypothetical protein K2P41_16560, partial [Lachnospiraceae bacterium]|nr:hypothetical protein [Lachnospiraceae bacterium]